MRPEPQTSVSSAQDKIPWGDPPELLPHFTPHRLNHRPNLVSALGPTISAASETNYSTFGVFIFGKLYFFFQKFLPSAQVTWCSAAWRGSWHQTSLMVSFAVIIKLKISFRVGLAWPSDLRLAWVSPPPARASALSSPRLFFSIILRRAQARRGLVSAHQGPRSMFRGPLERQRTLAYKNLYARHCNFEPDSTVCDAKEPRRENQCRVPDGQREREQF